VSKKRLPQDVIDQWPEIFKDVNIEVIPLYYLDSVRVTFENGKVWDIDTSKALSEGADEDLESALDDIFNEYEEEIVNVDFRLDIEKVKRDIQKRTNRFLKKRK